MVLRTSASLPIDPPPRSADSSTRDALGACVDAAPAACEPTEVSWGRSNRQSADSDRTPGIDPHHVLPAAQESLARPFDLRVLDMDPSGARTTTYLVDLDRTLTIVRSDTVSSRTVCPPERAGSSTRRCLWTSSAQQRLQQASAWRGQRRVPDRAGPRGALTVIFPQLCLDVPTSFRVL